MRLHRDARPPVRIAHLGLGGFFRAHQAWYTGAAPDAADWGIAAFTGRSRTLADELSAQAGLYTLVTRGPDHDEMSVQTASPTTPVPAVTRTVSAVRCSVTGAPRARKVRAMPIAPSLLS